MKKQKDEVAFSTSWCYYRRIKVNSQFEILIPEEISTTEPPTKEELKILHEIDPTGIVLRK